MVSDTRRVGQRSDLRLVIEVAAVVALTWLLLGWTGGPITQLDGSHLVVPLTQGQLTSVDWRDHLYDYDVVGGSIMHGFSGELPLVQACAALGLSTTATVDAVSLFVQLAFGVLSIAAIESLVTIWRRRPVRLTLAQRVCAVWLTAFSPLVGWRLGVGHENLLLGLLPFLAAFALLAAARADRLGPVLLAVGALAVAHGVCGLGAQTVVYGAVFGLLPVLAVCGRPTRRHAYAAAALAAGVLAMLPRLVPMIAHAASPDASRGIAEAAVYSYGHTYWQDWLASIPWTLQPGLERHEFTHLVEADFPLGPLLVFPLWIWPRGVRRHLLWATLASAALAIVLADRIEPVSGWLLHIPLLESFRVPSRAIMPIAALLPILALAACWCRDDDPVSPRRLAAALAGAAVAIALGHYTSSIARELLAWGAALAVVAARRAEVRQLALVAIAALGPVAFSDRIPREVLRDSVDGQPARVHDRVAANPLERVTIVWPPEPFELSFAWAARLPSIEGLWYPPPRFNKLIGALGDREVSPMTSAYYLRGDPAWPTVLQLYNVRSEVYLTDANDPGTVKPLAPTRGPAWFARHVVRELDAGRIAAGLRADPYATAFVEDDIPEDERCAQAQVTGVARDGQRLTIQVDHVAARCLLVVSTNYVTVFTGTVDTVSVPVVPVDIALTGIVVPPGAHEVQLAPEVAVPLWSQIAAGLGLFVLATAIALAARGRELPAS